MSHIGDNAQGTVTRHKSQIQNVAGKGTLRKRARYTSFSEVPTPASVMASVRREPCHSCGGGDGANRRGPTTLWGRLTSVHSSRWVVLVGMGQLSVFAVLGRFHLKEKGLQTQRRIKATVSHPSVAYTELI